MERVTCKAPSQCPGSPDTSLPPGTGLCPSGGSGVHLLFLLCSMALDSEPWGRERASWGGRPLSLHPPPNRLSRAACLGRDKWFQVCFKLNYWPFIRGKPFLDSMEMPGFLVGFCLELAFPTLHSLLSSLGTSPHRGRDTVTLRSTLQRCPVQTGGLEK